MTDFRHVGRDQAGGTPPSCIGCGRYVGEFHVVTCYTYAKARQAAEREMDDRRCTGLAAIWCPIHGDCTCPARENRMDDPSCPLHSPQSSHA